MSAEDKSIIVLNFFVLYVYLNKHLIHNLVLLWITRVPGAESPGNTVFLLRVHRIRTTYFFSYSSRRRVSNSCRSRWFSSSSFAMRLSFASISTSFDFDVRSYFLCHAPAFAASSNLWLSISFRTASFVYR